MERREALAILVCLGFSATAYAGPDTAAGQDRQFTGEYYGQVHNGPGLARLVTRLHLTGDGRLEGDYAFQDLDGSTARGTLARCRRARFHLTCEWHDKYGFGPVQMEFDPSLTSFQGQWTDGRAPVRWWEFNGSRGMS